MYRLTKLFAIFSTCFLIQAVNGQTYTDAGNLLEDITSNYYKDVIPLNNQSEFIKIYIYVSAHSISEINFVRGFTTITFSTTCSWRDEKITWIPSDYNGKEFVLIGQDKIWTPTIQISTAMEYTVVGSNEQRVRYKYDGHAVWTPFNIVKNVCIFHVKFWPFDKQMCYLAFTAFEYKDNELQLDMIGHGIDTSEIDTLEWTIERSYGQVYMIHNNSFVIYFLKLKRRPTFYVLSIIIPMTLLNLLAPCVFLLPSASGERVGFSITILLSITVFVTVISDEIPRTADPIALICGFVMSQSISCIIICVAVILNLHLYHRTDKINPWLKRLYISHTNKRIRIKDNGRNVTEFKSQNELSMITEDNIARSEDNDKKVITWQDISISVDMILFIMSFTIVSVSSVIFLIYLPTASDYLDVPP